MPDFGFSLQKDRQIDFDANDKTLTKRVVALEPSFRICIACGTCSATCTAANFTDYSLRRMITAVKRGELAGLAEDIEKCMFCGKCQLACPRGVSNRNLILAIRKGLHELQANKSTTESTK
jgi:heterodisulfide reductase subunit C